MRYGPVTKLDKRDTATSKNIHSDVMSVNYDITVIFPIYDQFGAKQIADSECMVLNTSIFIDGSFFSYKNWQQN